MTRSRSDIQRLLEQVDLYALVERDGITLRPVTHGPDREMAGACPKCGAAGHAGPGPVDRFHVRTWASGDGLHYFFCRRCHPRRGDAIEYLRWTRGLSFVEALDELSRITGIAAPAQATKPARSAPAQNRPDPVERPPSAAWQREAEHMVSACVACLWSPSGAAALAYLRRERGLSDTTIRAFRLGFNPAWRSARADGVNIRLAPGITIPHQCAGALWGVNVRQRADRTPKYIRLTGSRSALFNVDALRYARVVVVCAGEFDALLAQQHAPPEVACVTFGSETKRPTLQWRLALARVDRIIVAYDADEAGAKGTARWQAVLKRVEAAHVPTMRDGDKDITDYWRAGGDVAAWLREVTQY